MEIQRELKQNHTRNQLKFKHLTLETPPFTVPEVAFGSGGPPKSKSKTPSKPYSHVDYEYVINFMRFSTKDPNRRDEAQKPNQSMLN